MATNVIPLPRTAAKPAGTTAGIPPSSFRFTKTSLRTATEAAGENVTLRDTDLRGFILRRQKRDWVFGIERRIDKRLHRITLGQWTGTQNIEDIRKKAEALIGQIAAGTYVDPRVVTVAQAASIKTEALTDMGLQDALRLHLRVNSRTRATTAQLYAHCLLRFVGIPEAIRVGRKADPIGTVPNTIRMADIDRDMVRAAYERVLTAQSAASAAGMLAALRAVWNTWAAEHAEGEEPTQRNPVEALTKKRGTVVTTAPKERFLHPALRRPWFDALTASACRRGPAGTPERALRVLFLTGMRRDEVLSLRWTDISDDRQTFTVPADRMKAHVALTRPITPRIAAIFAEQKSFNPGSPWVFPAVRGGGHAIDPKKAMAAICRQVGVTITNHDLRRTYIGTAKLAGVNDLAIELLVGHTVSDITDKYGLASVRAQLPAIAGQIEDVLLGEVAP